MPPANSSAVSRRRFLLTAGGATAATASSGTALAQEEVTIDMTDELVFVPDSTTVEPGTTVVWENVGEIGHTVTAYEDDIPDDAAFFSSGDFEDEQSARDAYPDEGNVPGGESYEHTFEVEGTYEYFCIPHEDVGMIAELVVTSDGGDGTGDGDGGIVTGVPDIVRTSILVLVAATLIVIVFGFFFLKYGGDYGPD